METTPNLTVVKKANNVYYPLKKLERQTKIV